MKAYSTKKLADKWDVSSQHIRNMIERKELSCFWAGKVIRIKACEVERIENLQNTETHGVYHGESQALPSASH